MTYSDLAGRLAGVRDAIAHHQGVGGWSHPVTVVGVVKGHGPEAVRAAAAVGLSVVGENRVQEALGKMDAVPDVPVAWHLIGTLQRNKVKHVIGRFALLHAVDRPELVAELSRRVPAGVVQPVLLEVNCSGEAQKAGVTPEALPALLDAARGAPGLAVRGLMTMAPFTDDERVQRAAFGRLRALRDADGDPALAELSMGMSADYRVAVEEGATMVRLGTVLFGERSQ